MSASTSHVEIDVVIQGKTETLREPVPNGFPPDLVRVLADFMRRGFEACRTRLESTEMPSLADMAPSTRGRPPKPELEKLCPKIDELVRKGRSYGQIAIAICPKKTQPKHKKCTKECSDSLRHAYKYWLQKQEQARIEEELLSFD